MTIKIDPQVLSSLSGATSSVGGKSSSSNSQSALLKLIKNILSNSDLTPQEKSKLIQDSNKQEYDKSKQTPAIQKIGGVTSKSAKVVPNKNTSKSISLQQNFEKARLPQQDQVIREQIGSRQGVKSLKILQLTIRRS